MNENEILMVAELRESADVVSRQLELLVGSLRKLSARLRARAPQVVVTCARGSSAHAANFGKYLIERYIGIPVAAAAPSITTIYERSLHLQDQLFIAVSQSGSSDDLVEATASAKAAGALTVGILNDTESSLASVCDVVLPMSAGPELSVAATKSFIGSLSLFLNLVGAWADEASIRSALERLPDRLAKAAECDWTQAIGTIASATSLATLGRGPTLAIAQEAALKLKEVCNIHAEAFSGAEFQHGPVALVSRDYPVLIFMPSDKSADNLAALAIDLYRKRGAVFATGFHEVTGDLPVLSPDHPDTDAICLIQAFYEFAIQLAVHRGMDIDQPRHIQKITRTR